MSCVVIARDWNIIRFLLISSDSSDRLKGIADAKREEGRSRLIQTIEMNDKRINARAFLDEFISWAGSEWRCTFSGATRIEFR